MPLLNYSTVVAASRSLGEIQDRLARHGASAVTVVYADREPVALTFTLLTPVGPQTYRLPANIPAIERLLASSPRATKTRAQATRVAWRIIKDWVEAQLALIEAEQATLDQAMLPYLEIAPGRVLYDAYLENGVRLLPERGES